MAWWDINRLFRYAFTDDPISKREKKFTPGIGTGAPDTLDPKAQADGTTGGRGVLAIRDSQEFVDLSTVTNRMHRYKEYDRLRVMPEIENAMTVFADEACLAGETKVATPAYDGGFKTLEWLEANMKDQRFLCYAYDFEKEDYTLAWAFNPRVVKEAETVKVVLDDGSSFIATPDHRILARHQEWVAAGKLKKGTKLMPFYHLRARQELTGCATNQFPRLYSHRKGWLHERQFIDEWRTGKEKPELQRLNRLCRIFAQGISDKYAAEMMNTSRISNRALLKRHGFSLKEIKWLAKKTDYRTVVAVLPWKRIKVYDLSVEKHENFCTDWGVAHNCQKDEKGRVFQIVCKNKEVVEELEYLMFHRRRLNLDQKKVWSMAKNTFINGDHFYEVCIDPENPKAGIAKLSALPPDSMYRIETTKGRLVEFQQGKEGPDYQSLARVEVTQATDADLAQATAIRFAPEQIVHTRIGDDRKTFYPYGVSLIEPARGPAHQLRMMEDAMVVYRLSRAPERRVFYIDISGLPSAKAEAFIERMKDQFRKKKIAKNNTLDGASAVEERWHPPAADEDYWIPIRPNTQTRVETLPGACLSLNTDIMLLDGRTLTLSEVIREFDQGKQLWVYSCDPNTGRVAPGKITWAGITRKNSQVMRIKLDNDETITCTPDHKFPVLGRGFVEAKDLTAGDRLIPFNKRLSKIRDSHKSTYEQFYDPFKKKWIFTHRMVAEFFNSIGFGNEKIFDEALQNEEKNTVHHVDLNRYNNNPENLAWMNNKDHRLLHEWLSSEYAQVGGKARAAQIQDWKEKNDPRYQEFVERTKKIFQEWRQGISREERREVNRKISNGIKNFWKELSQEERVVFEAALKERGLTGSKVLRKLLKDPAFKVWFGNKISKGFDKFRNSQQYQQRSDKISTANKFRWQDPAYKKACFEKQPIIYPKKMMDLVQQMTKAGCLRKDIISCLAQDKRLLKQWKSSNCHIKRQDVNYVFTVDHFEKMVKAYGYKNWKQLKEEVNLYNHQIISVEILDQKQDVGTITVDGNEDFHGYHTFALACGVFTKNSNLGEIDDTVYFRNKLFIALNFPRNYFNNEDVQTTRVSLSSLDIKFARMIERLQSHIEDSFYEICERHLRLRGFPEESYEDLEVRMTPPSDWREMTRAEVVSTRIQNAGALKGGELMSLYDIHTKWMKYNEDETKLMLARLKLEKLENLKFQIIAQNPQLLGVGLPGPDEQQVGTEAGEQNPMLGGMPDMGGGPDMGAPPVPPPGPAPGGSTGQSIMNLPEPSDEDLRKYDLEIRDFGSEMDEPEVDDSEI